MVKLPKVDFSFLRKTLFLTLLLTFTFSAGYVLGFQKLQVQVQKFPDVKISREPPPDRKPLDFNLFWRVWDTLSEKYYDQNKLVPAKMVYGAIEGMVAAVGDPYTIFLPPEVNKVVQEDLSGSFEGVGIQIGFKGTRLAVIAPLPSSPAEKAGVRPGDFILRIKDEAKGIDIGTVGITLPDAVQAIRGQKNTKVTLTILRDGEEEPKTFEIQREAINVPSITLEYVGGSPEDPKSATIAHIKIAKFAGETLSEWEKVAVKLVSNKDLTGMIIDVRNNPGGFLQGAIDLSSEFLETGQTVVSEDGVDGKKDYKVEKLGRFRKTKIVVLMNEGSASASEIFAGAMKDNKRAVLVGTTTFGKGTIQEPETVNGGAGLHITIARWLTPSGYWVNEVGLKPDTEVENSEDTELDEQLEKAIELLSKN